MEHFYFAIPYVADLQTEAGWSQDPDSEHTYSIVRCHFLLRGDRQLNEPVRKGEVVGASTSLNGVTQKVTYSTEYEVTTMKLAESVKESLKESEDILEFVSSLTSSISLGKIGKLGGEVKSSSKSRLHLSFKDTFKVQVSETLREKKVVAQEYTVDPSKFASSATIVSVKPFKRYAYDLYLLYLDYLVIEYKRPPLGVRLKRSKIPPVTGNRHPNIVKLDLSLCSILFWKQVPNNLLIVNEKGYTNEVEDPFELTIVELKDSKKFAANLPPKPTLYDLSERAFPRKKWG